MRNLENGTVGGKRIQRIQTYTILLLRDRNSSSQIIRTFTASIRAILSATTGVKDKCWCPSNQIHTQQRSSPLAQRAGLDPTSDYLALSFNQFVGSPLVKCILVTAPYLREARPTAIRRYGQHMRCTLEMRTRTHNLKVELLESFQGKPRVVLGTYSSTPSLMLGEKPARQTDSFRP
jgi:hypothetical protein